MNLLVMTGLFGAAAALAAPVDTPRSHVETARGTPHRFTVRLGGTLDASNTRDPVFAAPPAQAFEPMVSVRLANAGDTDLVNPWLTVNGKRDWRTVGGLAAEALRAAGDPSRLSDADKARAVYEFFRANRFHATTGDLEVRDPVKLFNIYGYALCGDNAPALLDLWRAAGLRVRRAIASGHCVGEVYYDRGWHMMDADMSELILERDNRTVAGDRQLSRDHDLVRRGVFEESNAALYVYDGPRGGEYPSHAFHSMRMRLRPGEAIEWRWSHSGRHHQAASPLFAMDKTNLREHWGDLAWARLANGKWSFAPPLGREAARAGVEGRNVRWTARGAEPERIGEPATLTWRIETPYVIVGGSLNAEWRGAGSCALSISHDGRDWKAVAPRGRMDAAFPQVGPARYSYLLKAELRDARLETLLVENDLQMAPSSLPSLQLGENDVAYSDETAGGPIARIALEWVERAGVEPPAASAAPVSPAHSAHVEGTALTFRWREARTAPGDRIVSYHFQLGKEGETRWPLSSRFDVVCPEPSHAVPVPGLLNPGERYWWRVRAKSDKGVWGAWSAYWTFTPQGPGIPVNLRLEEAPDGHTLAWDANPAGRRPARYIVYSGDEKGFTPSDKPYLVNTGNQKTLGLFPGRKSVEFPPNRLLETGATTVTLQPGHAFYRVVAVDAAGVRSGPSDYLDAPRPFIFTKPPNEAKVGQPWRYQARTVRSIGHLTYRDFPPKQYYQAAFWDPDEPVFSLIQEIGRCGNNDPPWLKLDSRTGVLSGTPAPGSEGEYQINIRVDTPGAGSYVQSFPLEVVP